MLNQGEGMKRIVVRYAVDMTAFVSVGSVVGFAHGYWWGVVAIVATAVYGLVCFADGLIDR
jgi:UPF0716 family protein affecting phage T7 exclusion